jgi:predicted acylesterase/phospholipase RssA
VSSNLSKADLVVHQQGRLWECIRSSIAIPGIFSPVLSNGDVLVDGGVMNNFPTDIMAELCEGGTVIGVNACPFKEQTTSYDFEASVSGWQVLWRRLNPFASPARVPSLLGSLTRCLEINSLHQLRSAGNLADLLIMPDTHRFSGTDYASYKEIAEVGYQAAREKLAGWNRGDQEGDR